MADEPVEEEKKVNKAKDAMTPDDMSRSKADPTLGQVDFDYAVQGGDKSNKVGTLDRDLETERRKRAIDRLNNRAFARRAMYGLGETNQGDYLKANQLESEDKEQQDLRRQAESERRSWNMGLKQSQSIFDKDLELMKGRQQAINDIHNGFMGSSVMGELSDLQLGYFAAILNWATDNRGILKKLIDELTRIMGSDITGQGKGKDG